MSSTNRGGERDALDRYYTPQALADAIVGALDTSEGPGFGWVLEPSVGGGAFARAVRKRWRDAWIGALDIDPAAAGAVDCNGFEAGNFLALPAPIRPSNLPSLIIGNPPFRDAEAHIRQALAVVEDGGHVVFLLRLAMLEGQARRALWAEHPPKRVLVLSRRPSFTGGATDSAAYGVFIWRRGFAGVPALGWLDWSPLMLYLGIDPGPTTCGLVLYHPAEGRVREADSTLTVDEALRLVRLRASNGTRIAIERVQSTGQAGRSLLETSEVVGRLWQAAAEQTRSIRLLYRREVLAALDVTGRGNRDAMVRQRMLEMHPGGVGTKRAPGPLYGVAGHAWQALAVAVAASILDERERRAKETT